MPRLGRVLIALGAATACLAIVATAVPVGAPAKKGGSGLDPDVEEMREAFKRLRSFRN